MHSHEEKISPKCVLRRLIELSTMSNGSTACWIDDECNRTDQRKSELRSHTSEGFGMCQPSIVSSFGIVSNVGFGWGVNFNPGGSGTLRTLSTTYRIELITSWGCSVCT